MGHILVNKDVNGDGREFRTDQSFWSKYLSLAHEFGWESKGTELIGKHPDEDMSLDQLNANWDGNYTCNHGQLVHRDDALNIATALEKALNYMAAVCGIDPFTVVPTNPNNQANLPSLIPQYEVDKQLSSSRLMEVDIWTLNLKLERIKEIINFCRQGEFVIW